MGASLLVRAACESVHEKALDAQQAAQQPRGDCTARALSPIEELDPAYRTPWGTAACCALSWSMMWLSPLLARTPFEALLDDALPLR